MEYLFIALIPIVAVAIIVILAKRIASHTFKCKHCSEEFNIKWLKVVVTEHSGNEYMLVCPCCKTKGWCTEQSKKQLTNFNLTNRGFKMKKLESMPGGKFIVIIFVCAFAVILTCGLIALFSDIEMGLAAIGFSIIPLALIIFHIKAGYLSYITVSELGISDNKGTTTSWDNVRFTLYISDPRIYYIRGQVDVLYIDDHYLTADEIKKDKTKSFVVVMPKVLEGLLSKYNNKIQFINSPCAKRHKEFIDHNKSFEYKQI